MVDRIVMVREIPVLLVVQLCDVRLVSQGFSVYMVNAADRGNWKSARRRDEVHSGLDRLSWRDD